MQISSNDLAKILIIDDNLDNLAFIKEVLKQVNTQIFTAESGKAALELSLHNDFAVILLDVQMSNMAGYETATLIKAEEKGESTPIIFITEISTSELQTFNSSDPGIIDYLFKPLNPQVLEAKVKAFISMKDNNKRNNLLLLQKLEQSKTKLEEKNSQLEFLARHDSLTMLPNRLTFEADLKKVISSSRRYIRKFAILFIDLDNFKWINDNYGHDHGDIVLQQIASIINDSIREEDYSARIGGDEFAIILTDLNRYGNGALVADKIIEKVAANPLIVYNKQVNLTVSIGIACYPVCSKTAVTLVKQADIAMYRAKKSGKNNYCFFSEDIKVSFNKINSIREELQTALTRKELFLHYQPIVDMKENKIIGVESLLRWKNSKLGLIPPAEFIFLAEETRLIHGIGIWVIEETCKFIEKCRNLKLKDIFFSINISPRQLEQETFTSELNGILKKYKTNPAQIDLELTETNLTSFLNSSNKNYMLFLKQTHLRLSIDDFGTGYSSLDRLANLPINTLKIDGSFVTKINTGKKSNSIIKGIVALSKSLNMKTIAECVETKEQVDFLLANGCEIAQGFYYYKPMLEDKLLEIMIEQQ